jgi:hypothetical protein
VGDVERFMALCDEVAELLIENGCADGTSTDGGHRTFQVDCYGGQVRTLLELLQAGLAARSTGG